MKVEYDSLKKLIPQLNWPVGELADKMSVIGFEAVPASDGNIDVTLTSNRKDCQKIEYLAFDLAGVYGLKTTDNLVDLKLGQPIAVTTDQINRLLGTDISFDDVMKLTRLGFAVTPTSVTPPAFRDVATVADVAEEIVRIVGFGEPKLQPLSKHKVPQSSDFSHLQAIKIALAAAGLTETLTSSFSSHGHLKLKNPFADDEPFMREGLLDGLLKTLGKNPFLKRAAFFEIGQIFTPTEVTMLGIIIAGYKKPEELVAAIEKAIGANVKLEAVEESKAQKFDAKQGRIVWAQIALNGLKPAKTPSPASFSAPLPKFQPISKFPPLVRDLTFSADSSEEKKILKLKDEFPEALIVEQVDSYFSEQHNTTRNTYRMIFQKMENSFDESDIHQLLTEVLRFLGVKE